MQAYPLTPIVAHCPVCYGQEALLLYSVDTHQAARHVVPERADDQHLSQVVAHIGKLWQGSQCRFVRCHDCGFCFAVPYVSGDARLYSMVFADANYAPWRWEHQMTYDALRRRMDSTERPAVKLLEIGAGEGSFVKRVSPSLLPKENVFCLEYSDTGAHEIERYGIECSRSDIRDAEFFEHQHRFDAICMFHVLEHMDDLDNVFRSLGRLSNEGADLFIAVPNGKQRELYDRCGAIQDVPPTHIARWNRRSFEIMAERHGWVLVRHEIEPERYVSRLRGFLQYQAGKADLARPLTRPLRKIRSRAVRRLALCAILPICAILSLRGIIALTARDAGVSQYAHLQRGAIRTV